MSNTSCFAAKRDTFRMVYGTDSAKRRFRPGFKGTEISNDESKVGNGRKKRKRWRATVVGDQLSKMRGKGRCTERGAVDRWTRVSTATEAQTSFSEQFPPISSLSDNRNVWQDSGWGVPRTETDARGRDACSHGEVKWQQPRAIIDFINGNSGGILSRTVCTRGGESEKGFRRNGAASWISCLLTFGQLEVQLSKFLPHVLRELADIDVELGHH